MAYNGGFIQVINHKQANVNGSYNRYVRKIQIFAVGGFDGRGNVRLSIGLFARKSIASVMVVDDTFNIAVKTNAFFKLINARITQIKASTHIIVILILYAPIKHSRVLVPSGSQFLSRTERIISICSLRVFELEILFYEGIRAWNRTPKNINDKIFNSVLKMFARTQF